MFAHRETLPPVEEWWPYITIGARHLLIRDAASPLPVRVRREVAAATGHPVPEGATLSDDDRRFIVTQIEPMD